MGYHDTYAEYYRHTIHHAMRVSKNARVLRATLEYIDGQMFTKSGRVKRAVLRAMLESPMAGEFAAAMKEWRNNGHPQRGRQNG